MADLNEIQMARLARELAMNIRNYQVIFAEFGIDETDYQLIEKNEFFRKVKDQFAQEWNSTLSTEERLRIGSLAYLEQLTPVITRRAMKEDANLSASTDVSKVLMKMAGVGEPKADKANTEKFIITINMGADTEHYEKSIAIDPPTPEDIAADASLSAEIKAKTLAKMENGNGQTVDEIAQSATVKLVRPAGEGEGA